MNLSEFRKLIREEIRKVIAKQKNLHEGPLSGLVKSFDGVSKRLDYEADIKKAWLGMPKDTMQDSYDKLDPASQKEFVSLLQMSLKDATTIGILKLCKFILQQKANFDPKVVEVSATIAQIKQPSNI